MIQRLGLLATVALMGLLSFSDVHALEITAVRASRTAFNPADGESTDIRFHIDQPAEVELRVYDGRDLLIHRITKTFDVGEHVIAWNGKDRKGRVVPPEAYHYVLYARTESGESQTFDLTDLTGGERLTAQGVAWNPKTQQISYRLSEPARVHILIGLQDNGPLLRTLLEWVPRPAGPNQETWDGWDASRVLDLSEHPKLSIFVNAYSLSDNTLLVGEPPRASAFVDLPVDQRQTRPQPPPEQKRVHYHPQQPLPTRGDIDVSISLPKHGVQDNDSVPVVSGRVPVRLEVASKDRQRVLERRFEPVFFVDGTFVFENEVGYLPFTWHWDTADTPPGIHYVTVNLRGYEGNFGVATLKVKVQSSQQGEDS